ncbi:MAG: DUF4124 domain-containing protein, partial [Woeseiaceae bacterium]
AAAPGVVAAGDIYKWTDDNGVVHFGDRPSGADSETVIALNTESGSHRQAPARIPPPALSPATATNGEAAAASQGPTEEELRAEAEKRAEQCALYKERLQKFVTSRRLYREDENGERVYLDEEETVAARAKVQEQVLEYCSKS